MPGIRSFVSVSLTIAVLLASGCAAVNRKANEIAFNRRAAQSTVYAQLPPEQQERLARGVVAPGDSREMVRLALGEPDRVERTDYGERWIYEAYLHGGTSVTPETGPSGHHERGKATLVSAIAFRDGIAGAIIQRN